MVRLRLLRSIRAQLVLWSLCVNALLLIGLGVAVLFIFERLQANQTDTALQLGASQLVAVIDSNQDHLTIPDEDAALLAGRGLFAWVVNPQGKLDATVGRAGRLKLPSVASSTLAFQTIEVTDERLRLYAEPLDATGGALIIGMSLDESERASRTIFVVLAFAIPSALLLSSVGGFFLANRALRPIAAITAQAKRISRENLSERLAFSTSKDEVGALATTFDEMLDRLQATFESERRFISDASHELRTLLGILKAQIGLALSRPRTAETLSQMLRAMENDVDRMTRLVETMLRLTRAEATPLRFQSVDLGDLLAGLVTQMQPLAAERHIILSLTARSGARISGDPDQLVQLFLNLLDNAVKYTPDAGKVAVRLQQNQQEWRIDIQDSGVGIAPEPLSHLFDRFYRVDTSRTRETGGFGLGLPIAQAIARQHGGHISVQSQVGTGSTFSVFLPIINRFSIASSVSFQSKESL